MDKPLSMVILAGGQSSRMGTDKADLLWQGKSFLQIQIEKGRSLGIDDIQVSGYRGELCPFPVTPDRFPGKGPLAGIEACLHRAKHPHSLVLSVDAPLVPVEALEALILESRKQDAPVTIISANGQEQPLIGLYRTDLADAMAEEITLRKGSVFAFLRRVGYAVYESPLCASCFSNINTPEQFQNLSL